MTRNPCTVNVIENVQKIAQVLLSTPHGGYPVIKGAADEDTFFGFINRFIIWIN